MLKNLIKSVADATSLTQVEARQALGIVLNAAERQGAPLAEAVFQKMPGARTLSATKGADLGAATGVIARLIEQTPGGRRHVYQTMIRDLQNTGLGHSDITILVKTLGDYMRLTYGIEGFGHLGDLMATEGVQADTRIAIAA